uniref:TLDc domain-containing protein n=1 Tax=Macrostomum lignano TaxID=282301 RepID=A0A1I8G0H2_9PLAT
ALGDAYGQAVLDSPCCSVAAAVDISEDYSFGGASGSGGDRMGGSGSCRKKSSLFMLDLRKQSGRGQSGSSGRPSSDHPRLHVWNTFSASPAPMQFAKSVGGAGNFLN